MDDFENESVLVAIRQDLTGLGLGLIVGAAACYFVRPKTKATCALEMAQRWLAWGLLGSLTSGFVFAFRNHEHNGWVGAIISVLFFSGLAWVLGLAWGLLRFGQLKKTQSPSINAETPNAGDRKANRGILIAGGVGLVIMGLVAVSALKSATEKNPKKIDFSNWSVEEITSLAETGSDEAQFMLGILHQTGEVVPQDIEKAAFWYRKALENGNAWAAVNLAFLLQRGEGIPQDDAEAAKLLRFASDKGDVAAHYSLGLMYAKGNGGLPKDNQEAVKFWRKAADLGDANSMNLLYKAYRAGFLPNESSDTVNGWLQQAAEEGYPDAQYDLGLNYYHGKGVPKDLPKAVSLFQQAAEEGYPDAQYVLGGMYGRGDGVPKSLEKAAQLIKSSADQGYPNAEYELGLFYANGEGSASPKNEAEALKWFLKAAQQGYALAQSELGRRFLIGLGFPPNEQMALYWMTKAAEQGDPEHEHLLGAALLYGLGVVKMDPQAGLIWLRKAGDKNHAKSQSILGLLYSIGDVVPQDYTKALELYLLAAKGGSADAFSYLATVYARGDGVTQDFSQAYIWGNLASAVSALSDEEKEITKNLRDSMAAKLTPEQLLEAQAESNRMFKEMQSKTNEEQVN